MSDWQERAEAEFHRDETLRVWSRAVDEYSAAADLSARIGRMARERRDVLPDWLTEFLDARVHELFENQAALHGEYEAER